MTLSVNDKTSDLLRQVGLRPTKQRLALAEILFGQGKRHVTADSLYSEALGSGINISLATIYNVLHTFTSRGLLREISIDSSKSYFDTNTEEHHHFYYEKTGRLEDFKIDRLQLGPLPDNDENLPVSRVDVVIRLDG